MLCNFCHKPVKEVIAATENPSKKPHGNPRPFHCPCRKCHHTRNEKTVENNWTIYLNPEAAKKAGHERACLTCMS